MRINSFEQLTASILLAVLGWTSLGQAQSPPDPNYVRQEVFPSYQAFKDELNAIAATSDATARNVRLNSLWSTLQGAGQVPYAQDNRYALLYRGSASSVAFPGDHNSWSANASPATQLAGTNLWLREGMLPTDARVDYKIVLNGNSWILDPVNSLQMWSGFGPNSELRMPNYEYPHETIRRLDAARGALGANVRVSSANLGYQVQYRVYTPAGYTPQQLANLPVVYVTDGHEYAADHMGSLVAVLDNLIDDGTLRPTIAVFIDPRDPNNLGNNRRLSEYNSNPKFTGFVSDELVPAIDAAFRTSTVADDRVILGTSMGGLIAAYFGATESDTFRKIAIQSPAFAQNPSIYGLYDQSPQAPLEIYMTAGTINDGSGGTNMNSILAANGYDYTFLQANQGHSWGNWRGELAEMLVALVGPPPQGLGDFNDDGLVDAADFTLWRDTLGQNTTRGFGADGNSNGSVDQADHEVWRQHFGKDYRSGGGQNGSASRSRVVPEPSAGCLLSIGAVAAMVGRCRSLVGRNSSCRHLAERRQLRGFRRRPLR